MSTNENSTAMSKEELLSLFKAATPETQVSVLSNLRSYSCTGVILDLDDADCIIDDIKNLLNVIQNDFDDLYSAINSGEAWQIVNETERLYPLHSTIIRCIWDMSTNCGDIIKRKIGERSKERKQAS